jgi:hypothetical protein
MATAEDLLIVLVAHVTRECTAGDLTHDDDPSVWEVKWNIQNHNGRVPSEVAADAELAAEDPVEEAHFKSTKLYLTATEDKFHVRAIARWLISEGVPEHVKNAKVLVEQRILLKFLNGVPYAACANDEELHAELARFDPQAFRDAFPGVPFGYQTHFKRAFRTLAPINMCPKWGDLHRHAEGLQTIGTASQVSRVYNAFIAAEMCYHHESDQQHRLNNHVNPLARKMTLQPLFTGQASRRFFTVISNEDTVFVAFPGTHKFGGWTENDLVADVRGLHTPVLDGVGMHAGFYDRFKATGFCEDFQRLATDPSFEFNKKADGQLKDLVFTGHSLGAAVAAIFTMHVLCTNAFPGDDATRKRIHSIMFALPLLGGEALANYIERKTSNITSQRSSTSVTLSHGWR